MTQIEFGKAQKAPTVCWLWKDFCADICWRFYLTAKSNQSQVFMKKEVRFVCLHNGQANLLEECTAKQLAAAMGKNPKYVSQVLNGHYSPKKAEVEFNEAFKRLTAPEP